MTYTPTHSILICHGCEQRAITAVAGRKYFCPTCESHWSLSYGPEDDE